MSISKVLISGSGAGSSTRGTHRPLRDDTDLASCTVRATKPTSLPDRKPTVPTNGTISAVIPTHGRDVLLAVALRSVLAQSLSPIEVFVVDDLGSAATRALVDEVAGGASIPVRYLDGSGLDPKTAGASRNLGASRATADYLAFLDDDDYWHEDFLDSTRSLLESGSHDFVVGWTDFERDGRMAPGLTMPSGLGVRGGLSRSGLTGSNALVTASAFHSIGGFDDTLRVLNDFDYLRRLLAAELQYGVVDRAVVTQVSHDLGHLSTRSLPRAAVIRAYRDRNRAALSRGDRRHLSRLMHASARGADATPIGRLVHGLAQAAHTSPSEWVGGVVRRLKTGSGMYV
ncbi:MAG: hypothetical protein RI885_2584 [Actinomycetota bacterium]|jgi:glycosyltransferase involved in cell wall biosynthesis